jgi:hypothetical protein
VSERERERQRETDACPIDLLHIVDMTNGAVNRLTSMRFPAASWIPPVSYVQIFSSTLFSGSLNLCSSLWVRDQVSNQYKTRD